MNLYVQYFPGYTLTWNAYIQYRCLFNQNGATRVDYHLNYPEIYWTKFGANRKHVVMLRFILVLLYCPVFVFFILFCPAFFCQVAHPALFSNFIYPSPPKNL